MRSFTGSPAESLLAGVSVVADVVILTSLSVFAAGGGTGAGTGGAIAAACTFICTGGTGAALTDFAGFLSGGLVLTTGGGAITCGVGTRAAARNSEAGFAIGAA
ncbi:MAG: hypothetical protein ACLPXM_20305, partial [Terriglobales bacterium]